MTRKTPLTNEDRSKGGKATWEKMKKDPELKAYMEERRRIGIRKYHERMRLFMEAAKAAVDDTNKINE